MTDFNERARTWDKPSRVERSKVIFEKLKPILSGREVLMEYGAGTGLLGLHFVEQFEKVILVDDSEKMLEVAQEKINHFKYGNVETLKSNFLVDPLPNLKVDAILIMMTLHHIVETSSILKSFSKLLQENGQVVIIDLVKDDGTFHDHEFEGHSGFEREKLETQLNQAGLIPKSWEIGYIIQKERGGKLKDYPLFISSSVLDSKN